MSSVLVTSLGACRSAVPNAASTPLPTNTPTASAAPPPIAEQDPARVAGPTWTFGDVTWEVLDDRKIERRERGGAARGWSFPEDITPAFMDPDHERILSCAFFDEQRAWCAGLEGADHDRHIVVFRTADGARTWRRARLPRERYTEWAGGPWVTITFTSSSRVSLDVVDAAQHHNGHLETKWRHVSKDGGSTWWLDQKSAKCHDAANHCRGG